MMALGACGNKEEQLQKQVDSLRTALTERQGDYDQLNSFLFEVSAGLDSINSQEETLWKNDSESPLPSRDEVKARLKSIKNTLGQQRDRISRLEKELAANQGDAKKLRGVIAALKEQLEQKDAQITELLAQLEQSNLSIEELRGNVEKLNKLTSEQASTIATQSETLQSQDKALNEGFVKIATKSELKAAGLLQGGFLKKSKVDYTKVDRSLFQTVDIREVTEIPIPSKKAKILTPIPTDSYTLREDGQSTILTITNPTRFWSVSNFLIIQI